MPSPTTSTPEIPSLPRETVAYLVPSESGIDLIVNPVKVPNVAHLTEESKTSSFVGDLELVPSRLQTSIEEDLKLNASSSVLPISVLDRSAEQVYTPESENFDVWLHDEEPISESEKSINDIALYGHGRRQNGDLVNVSSWVSLHLEGGERQLHDPRLPEYIGALIAREVRDDIDDKKVLLEDHSGNHIDELTIVDENFDQASAITQEYDTSNLDEAIIEDRKRLRNRAKRFGAWVTNKVRLPDNDGQPIAA